MKKWWRRSRPYLLSALIYGAARFIGRTIRLRVVNASNTNVTTGAIFCGWHGRSLIPANYFKGKGLWALFSLSNDGEMQSRIFKRFGFQVIRGSTGRGGARAAIEAIRLLRQGDAVAITPDGPRGPVEVVQGGVILMAQKSGAALIAIGSAAKPRIRAPTWDSYMVPLPFSRAAIVFGEPIYVPENASEQEIEGCRIRLEAAIQEAERVAALEVGSKPEAAPKAARVQPPVGSTEEKVVDQVAFVPDPSAKDRA